MITTRTYLQPTSRTQSENPFGKDEQRAITSAIRERVEAAQYHSVITPAPAVELIRLKPNIKKRNMNI
jgi:hypothetical protein